jgi:hypothetical protein
MTKRRLKPILSQLASIQRPTIGSEQVYIEVGAMVIE